MSGASLGAIVARLAAVAIVAARSAAAILPLTCAAAAAAAQAPSAAASAAAPLVVGETFTIDSRVLGEVRRINVYVPPRYGADTAAPLPVLYMPDGGIGEDFLHVAGLVQVSVGNGTMRPVVLVGIENTERRRDMTGPTRSDADRRIAPRVGGSASFRTFLRTELMPAIAARYRVTDETAIVGESLAGLFVVETFLLEPALFDTYVAIDPSLWWDDGRLVATADERLRAAARSAAGRSPATLYLASSGEPELAALARRLAAVLTAGAFADVRWRHVELPAETHATIYHPAALGAFRAVLGPTAR